MTRKVEVLLVDDLDGGAATETVTFSLDGRTFEIDLNDENAKKLRESLAPYRDSARKVRKTGRKVQDRPANDRQRNTAIRQWARSEGIHVNDRGRIPTHVVEQYKSAT